MLFHTKHGDLYYELLTGNSYKPGVVFLHDLGSDSSSWYYQAEYLNQLGYTVLVVDLPDSGRSSQWATSYTLDEVVQVLSELLKQSGLSTLHLVGHALGGEVALALAEALDKVSIKSLTLISVGMSSQIREEESIAQFAKNIGVAAWDDAAVFKKIVSNALSFPDETEEQYRERMKQWYDNMLSSALMAESGFVNLLLNSACEEARQSFNALCRLYQLKKSYHQQQHDYERICQPLLLLSGDKDSVVLLRETYLLAAFMPNAIVHHFSGMKHAPHLELRDETNELLVSFFSDVDNCESQEMGSISEQ